MTKWLKMMLFSAERLTQETAQLQIKALSEFENGLFRPEKCNLGEPLREKFDPNDLREPVRWLSQPGGQFNFKKTKPFHVQGYIINRCRRQLWTRDRKGELLIPIIPKFPEPQLTIQWIVRVESKAFIFKGAELLKRFLVEMFLASKSEYGFLTADDDHEHKNYLVVDNGKTITSKFVGDDPEWGIPGLYWCNIFGHVYTQWLSPELLNIPALVEPISNGGTFVQFGASPEMWHSPEILDLQQKTMFLLGKNKFFDIRNPERRVETPFHPIVQ